MSLAMSLIPAVSQRVEVTIGTCLNCECEIVATVDVRTSVDVSIQAETGPTEISTDAKTNVQGAAVQHACGTLALESVPG